MIDPWCVCHSFLASRNSLPTVCYSSLVEMSCLPPVSFSGLPTELIFYCFLLLSHLPHHSPPAFSFWGSVSCGTLKGQWKHAPAGAVLYHDLSPLGVLRTNNKAKQKDTCWWFVTQLAQISLISCLCCSLSFLVSTHPPLFFLTSICSHFYFPVSVCHHYKIHYILWLDCIFSYPCFPF